MSEAATAWYVYGVVSSTTQAEGTGIDSRPVELVSEGDVAALSSAVPADEFGEATLRERLNDRAWLEQTAREHEETLERALARSPVIPFRLCTVYESRDRLREFLSDHGAALADLLRRLDGRVELGVKAYFAEAPAETGEPLHRRDRREEHAQTDVDEVDARDRERDVAAQDDSLVEDAVDELEQRDLLLERALGDRRHVAATSGGTKL